MFSSLPRFRTFILISGCCAIAIALMVLAGWQFNLMSLKSLLPGITPMNPVTALTFILAGIWIILYAQEVVRFRDIIGAIITLVGAIHFVTYFFPLEAMRLDYLFYGDVIRKSGIPNLIAPNTALNFFLCGIAMLTTGRGNKMIQVIRQCLIILSFFLVYTSVLGYIFNIQPAYRFGGLTPMALITSIAFLFVGAALFLSDTRFGIIRTFASPMNGGRLARRLVPMILVLPPAINYIAMIGEKYGLYSVEFGTQLSTFIFTLLLLFFVSFYAILSNAQHRAEKDQDLRMATLMNSLNDGILEADSNGYVLYVNPAFEKILGYSAEEIKGKLALDIIIPGKDRAKFEERLSRRKQGIEESYVSELLDKKGDRKHIALHAKPLYSRSGVFKKILVSIRDITDETRHLQDLRTFTDFAAHDLKAPLVNIAMLVELARGMEMNDEQLQVVEMIDETTNRMRILIDELLQFSKIGATELIRDNVDTASIVKEILAGMDTSRHQITIDPLPSVYANKATTRQVFINLISNALKYSSSVNNPAIYIGSHERSNRQWFRVSDNGIGIDSKFLPELFLPFKRFTSKFKGNGLGLAIVKRIVEKHGGQIEVHPGKEGGITFEFTLSPEIRNL